MKIFAAVLLLFSSIYCFGQEDELLGRWYFVSLDIDLEGTYEPPTSIVNETYMDFLDITGAINIVGESGCNSFELEAMYDPTLTLFTTANFGTTLVKCDDPEVTEWQEKLYWFFIEEGVEFFFQFSTVDGIDFLFIEHPLLSSMKLQRQLLSVEANGLTSFTVFPNPAANRLLISGATEDIQELCIYDLSGRKQRQTIFEGVIDVSQLTAGIYFLELLSENGKTIKKFIKK